MADAEHSRERATRILALALQAREEGRIEDAEQLTQLATQAFDRAAPTPPRGPAAASSRSIAQQQQQPQRGDSAAAEPRGRVTDSKPDDDRNT
jgi:hypothetical protein